MGVDKWSNEVLGRTEGDEGKRSGKGGFQGKGRGRRVERAKNKAAHLPTPANFTTPPQRLLSICSPPYTLLLSLHPLLSTDTERYLSRGEFIVLLEGPGPSRSRGDDLEDLELEFDRDDLGRSRDGFEHFSLKEWCVGGGWEPEERRERDSETRADVDG